MQDECWWSFSFLMEKTDEVEMADLDELMELIAEDSAGMMLTVLPSIGSLLRNRVIVHGDARAARIKLMFGEYLNGFPYRIEHTNSDMMKIYLVDAFIKSQKISSSA